ncbi:hypothetical protein ColLi_03122 [Colletotrichum liriopes]|uniref:Small secreted protein n=1 Tax=Colletotrichum liriopes TaxID=708192 RepID=A0AA37GGG8_9PEZI|nr:hypothetical protein ColLi_03122 [Colletotrichum liriopes]
MRYTQLILSLFLLFTFVIALPAPAPVEAVAAQEAADKPKKNGNKDKTTKGTTTKAKTNANGKKPAADSDKCVAAKKLANGIDKNIEAQKQEQTDVAKIKGIVSKDKVDQKAFDDAKKQFLTTINKGIDIRKQNQQITFQDNAATAGLKKVADAQAKELQQAKDLKGNKNDLTAIAQLEKEFVGGIDQNEKNKKDVSAHKSSIMRKA